MIAIVTGATGYVGSNFVKQLLYDKVMALHQERYPYDKLLY